MSAEQATTSLPIHVHAAMSQVALKDLRIVDGSKCSWCVAGRCNFCRTRHRLGAERHFTIESRRKPRKSTFDFSHQTIDTSGSASLPIHPDTVILMLRVAEKLVSIRKSLQP